MEKNGFFSSLGKRKIGVVLNLFYAYMSLGLVLIMLGSILPEMKADYALSYQVGGALLSVQSVGYVLAGLLAGYLPFLLGIKVSFILIQLSVTLGFIMLLISGNPVWLLIAMFLIGIGKGGITNYNNLLMNIYSEGNAGPLNILHACFAAGAVIAPLIAMVVTGWRPAVIIGCVCCAASLAFLLPAGFRSPLRGSCMIPANCRHTADRPSPSARVNHIEFIKGRQAGKAYLIKEEIRIAVRFAPIWHSIGASIRPLLLRSFCRIRPAGNAYSIWSTFPCHSANSAETIHVPAFSPAKRFTRSNRSRRNRNSSRTGLTIPYKAICICSG